MRKSAFSDKSTDREKFWHFFGVLLFKIPCSVLEISPFYIWGREPLLSILKASIGCFALDMRGSSHNKCNTAYPLT